MVQLRLCTLFLPPCAIGVYATQGVPLEVTGHTEPVSTWPRAIATFRFLDVASSASHEPSVRSALPREETAPTIDDGNDDQCPICTESKTHGERALNERDARERERTI